MDHLRRLGGHVGMCWAGVREGGLGLSISTSQPLSTVGWWPPLDGPLDLARSMDSHGGMVLEGSVGSDCRMKRAGQVDSHGRMDSDGRRDSAGTMDSDGQIDSIGWKDLVGRRDSDGRG